MRLLIFSILILALGVQGSCASLSLAVKESPACSSLGTPGSVLDADGKLVAQLALDLPTLALGQALDSFIAAKGPEQFECAYQIARALLGRPVAPLALPDAGVSSQISAQSPLGQALLMNHAAAQGALEKLQTYHSTRLLGGK